MSNTLYNIVGEFLQLYEMGEDEEAFSASLESLEFDLEVKASEYIHVMKQLEMEAEEAEKVEKAFAEKARVRKANVKRMKDRIKDCMELLGYKKIPAGEYTIMLKGNGGVKPLIKDSDIPDSFKKITIEDDDKKIRDFLKTQEGERCEWAHLGERGKHIEVK